jgi:hypothetical protein
VRRDLYPAIDAQVMARLTSDQARRYEREYARQALHARLREAQLAGHDLDEVVARITAEDLGGARSISSVLHSRLAGLGLDTEHDATWEQRTPAGASPLARDLARGLDDRTRELGVRAAAQTEPWLARRLGMLAPSASLTLRAEYEHRAGIAAAYREAAGITDPEQDIAADPHEGNPELETWRKAAMRALEIRDETEAMRAMSRGQLEAHVAQAERAVAAAPPDMSAELRRAAQAKADAWREHADAQVRRDEAAADTARLQAEQHTAAEAHLERQHASYEKWSEYTAPTRELGGKAQAELNRRGYTDLDLLAEIDALEEERRAHIDYVNSAPDAELESAIPDEVWEQARERAAEIRATAAAERRARLDEAMREYGADAPIRPEVVREAQQLREQRIAAYQARRAEETAAAPAEPRSEAGNDAQADLAPAPAGVEDPAPPRGAQPPPRSPETGGHESWASTTTRLDAEADPDPAVDPGYEPGPPDRPGPDPAPDHVAEMHAKMDAMSARIEQIEAERAEREAADDYYVYSSRQAEANAEAAAEPSPTPSDVDVDVDVELDMEPG